MIVAESNERPQFEDADFRQSGGTDRILDDGTVLPLDQEDRLLHFDAVDLIEKRWERIQAEGLEREVALRMHRSGILVDGQLNPAATQNQGFFETREHDHTAHGRPGSRDEQAVIAAGIHADDGGGCETAEAVGLQPFAAAGEVQVAADGFVELNHGSSSHSPLCCRSLATNPVQPV